MTLRFAAANNLDHNSDMAQNPDDFRRIALSIPQAVESDHMGHPDFRVKGKIFATLVSRDGVELGMVKLKPNQQRQFVKDRPEIFQAIKGGWGRQGCTQVSLDAADHKSLRDAIFTAWCNIAPKDLMENQPSSPVRKVAKSARHSAAPKARKSSVKKSAAKRGPKKREN